MSTATTTRKPATKRFSQVEALTLWRRYKATGDPRLRDRLIMTYAPLVKHIVYRKIREVPSHQEADDYIALWRLIAHYVGTPTQHFETPERARRVARTLLAPQSFSGSAPHAPFSGMYPLRKFISCRSKVCLKNDPSVPCNTKRGRWAAASMVDRSTARIPRG